MNPNRKKLIYEFILEKIYQAGDLALDGLFPKNRADGRLWRRALGLTNGYQFSRPYFSVALSRLSGQGLIKKSGKYRSVRWSLTKKGEEKIKSLVDFTDPIKPDGVPRLVMYDIPESDRKKRDWIRLQLPVYGYRPIQRSVWIGYNPLPESFLKSIIDLKLRNAVHIVGISKSGTMDIF